MTRVDAGPASRGPAPASAVLLPAVALATICVAALFSMSGVDRVTDTAPPVTIGPAQGTARSSTKPRPVEGTGGRLARTTTFQPAEGGGLMIVSTADAAALTEAGLRIGDVVVESDGRELPADGESRLREDWRSFDSVETTVLRDGRLRRLALALR